MSDVARAKLYEKLKDYPNIIQLFKYMEFEKAEKSLSRALFGPDTRELIDQLIGRFKQIENTVTEVVERLETTSPEVREMLGPCVLDLMDDHSKLLLGIFQTAEQSAPKQ